MAKRKNKPNPAMYGVDQQDAERAERIIEMCRGMDEKDLAKMANAANAIKLVRGLTDSLTA